jgi:hypothetical protein
MDITLILSKALSSNNQERNSAEKSLLEFSEKSYEEVIFELASELTNENRTTNHRQLAGTLLRNLIFHFSRFQQKYVNSNPQFKLKLKELILNCLASPEQIIQRTSADLISSNN